MSMNSSMKLGMTMVVLAAGCDTWMPTLPTEDELARGLVVMYPGSTNTKTEMQGFYIGLRDAHIDQAIEVVQWSPPLAHFFNPFGYLESHRPWTRQEAARIAAYREAHPGQRVTLIGFSGGAMNAIMVTEELPAGHSVDCVILMSPATSRYYDLAPMLERVSDGVIVYWSPRDDIAIALVEMLGTVDGVFSEPAASFGFAMEHEKLTQIPWDESMATEYGQNGNHVDYIWNIEWLRDYVGEWVKH